MQSAMLTTHLLRLVMYKVTSKIEVEYLQNQTKNFYKCSFCAGYTVQYTENIINTTVTYQHGMQIIRMLVQICSVFYFYFFI